MTTDEFWNLIHATSAPTQEEQLERFRAELLQLSQPELLEFMRYFYVTRHAAYTWDYLDGHVALHGWPLFG